VCLACIPTRAFRAAPIGNLAGGGSRRSAKPQIRLCETRAWVVNPRENARRRPRMVDRFHTTHPFRTSARGRNSKSSRLTVAAHHLGRCIRNDIVRRRDGTYRARRCADSARALSLPIRGEDGLLGHAQRSRQTRSTFVRPVDIDDPGRPWTLQEAPRLPEETTGSFGRSIIGLARQTADREHSHAKLPRRAEKHSAQGSSDSRDVAQELRQVPPVLRHVGAVAVFPAPRRELVAKVVGTRSPDGRRCARSSRSGARKTAPPCLRHAWNARCFASGCRKHVWFERGKSTSGTAQHFPQLQRSPPRARGINMSLAGTIQGETQARIQPPALPFAC